MNKKLYWLLSLTWGLPLTLIGAIAFGVLSFCGYNVQQNGWGWCIKIGKKWGGFSMGPFALLCKNHVAELPAHEFGHSIQNCIFGPFTLFFITIPSIIRYWLWKIGLVHHDYYYIWFEQQANIFGERYLSSPFPHIDN